MHAASDMKRAALLPIALLLPWIRFFDPPYQINLDVSWFYYVAHGLLHGGVLYRDYIDPNTPMASISLIPAVLLAQGLHLSPALAVEIYVLSAASLVMALNAAILRATLRGWGGPLAALIVLAVIFALLPRASFAQREHIGWLLLTPYALLCIAACLDRARPDLARLDLARLDLARLDLARLDLARLDLARLDLDQPAWHGWLAGLLAALAVSLKPPLLLMPLALEGAVLLLGGGAAFWRRRFWPPRRCAILLGLVLATMMVIVGFPAYWRNVVPWVRDLYGSYDKARAELPWISFCLPPSLAAWGLLFCTRHGAWRIAGTILMAGFVGGMLSFAAQGKGWFYQLLPAYGFMLALSATAIAAIATARAASRLRHVKYPLCAVSIWYWAFLLTFPTRAVDHTVHLVEVGGVAREIATTPGPFVIFSTNVYPSFPLALLLNHVWASRYPCMIMLPGITHHDASPVAKRWEAPYRAAILADMQRYAPALVMVPYGNTQAMPPGFDFLAWLLRDPRFTTIWTHYARTGTEDGFLVFRRQAE